MEKKCTVRVLAMLAVFLVQAPAYANDKDGVVGNCPYPVAMVSGGVGDDEELALSQEQNQYNLKLMFTEGNGMYLSDVQVHISDKNGLGVADTVTTGPILLVKLPPGKYKVTAVSGGVSRVQVVSVDVKLRVYQLRYPTKDTEG